MKLAVVAAALVCALAVPRIAAACQCESSAPLVVGAGLDSSVPPEPTLYVFTPNVLHDGTQFVHDIYVTNSATSRPNTMIRTRQIAIDPEYIVFAVESDALEGVLELHLTYGNPEVYRFMISRRPPENFVRPLELDLQDMTDCGLSEEKAITLTYQGNASAYAIDWDDGTKTVLPARRWDDGVRHDVRIGARCGTSNVALDHLHASHAMTVHALFADGSETLVGTSKLQLSKLQVRTPIELLDSRARDEDRLQATPMRTFVLHATANPTGAAVAGGAATGGLIVVGAALLRARRRRHATRL